MAKKIRSEYRNLASDKLMDLGNLAVAALVFGQFVGGKDLSRNLLFTGVIFMLFCYIMSYIIIR